MQDVARHQDKHNLISRALSTRVIVKETESRNLVFELNFNLSEFNLIDTYITAYVL